MRLDDVDGMAEADTSSVVVPITRFFFLQRTSLRKRIYASIQPCVVHAPCFLAFGWSDEAVGGGGGEFRKTIRYPRARPCRSEVAFPHTPRPASSICFVPRPLFAAAAAGDLRGVHAALAVYDGAQHDGHDKVAPKKYKNCCCSYTIASIALGSGI